MTVSTRRIASPAPKPPETILAPEPFAVRDALRAALNVVMEGPRRSAVATVVAANPRYLDAWAALSELGRDPVERYAAARVGYHRGLDALRQSGWRGSGPVRWDHVANRGFLRCVARLGECAEAIGEADEVARCATFLGQLDSSWPPEDLARTDDEWA